MIKCTSEVSARFNVGIRPQTAIVSSILNRAGKNIGDVNLSKSYVHKKRFEVIKERGNEIREDIIETLQGKRLVLHFDGKLVREISEDKKISVEVERIAVSVTSPDFQDKDDVLLGVIQSGSSKGADQAEIILKLLE